MNYTFPIVLIVEYIVQFHWKHLLLATVLDYMP